MTTIHEDRLERFLDPNVRLVFGGGSGANGTIDTCIMQAVDWIAGGDGHTDAPECADPVIRRFCIRLNDAARFSAFRDELKPYALKIVDTKGPLELTRKRSFVVADWAVRTLVPMALDHFERPEHAKKLRELAPVVDYASSKTARSAACEVRDVLREAALSSVKRSAASAAAAAAYAADAYARSKGEAFSRELWDESLRCLDRLIETRVEVAA